MPGTASYIVYPAGQQFNVRSVASDKDIFANALAETAIQYAMDQEWKGDPTRGPGDVYIAGGQYPIGLGKDFVGLSVHSFTNLKMDPLAEIIVPNGFTKSAFVLVSDDKDNAVGVNNTIIDGGWIHELQKPKADPPVEAQGQWSAFVLDAQSGIGGMQFNKLMNTRVDNANIGVSIKVGEKDSFINSNVFEGLRLWACRKFISFELLLPIGDYTANPVWGNTFCNLHCQVQCAEVNVNCNEKNIYNPIATSVGINNVVGMHNSFFSVNVWDIQRAVPNGKKMTISKDATSTLIVGGILYEKPNDASTSTKVYDS